MGWRKPIGILVLGAVALTGCSGPIAASVLSVPPAASYGHGSWAFRASFLTKPMSSGVRTLHGDGVVVASDHYQATYLYAGKQDIERVAIVELSHIPVGCLLREMIAVVGRCPTIHGDVLVGPSVSKCPKSENVCQGYYGSVVLRKNQMLFGLTMSGGTRSAVKAALQSLVPGV
jgi:hypothetical protein